MYPMEIKNNEEFQNLIARASSHEGVNIYRCIRCDENNKIKHMCGKTPLNRLKVCPLSEEFGDEVVELLYNRGNISREIIKTYVNRPSIKFDDNFKIIDELLFEDFIIESTLEFNDRKNGPTVPMKNNFTASFIQNNFKLFSDREHLYLWNSRYYAQMKEEEMYKFICQIYTSAWKDWGNSRYKEIQKYLISFNVRELKSLNQPSYLIPFKNGLYNIQSHKLEDFSPEYEFIGVFPYEYNDNPAPLFEFALKNMFPSEEAIDVFKTYIQYCLTPSIDHRQALILIGPKRSGKTRLISCIARIMGERATTFNLNSLTGDEAKYGLYEFMGKYMGFCSEIGHTEHIQVSTMELLKGIIGKPEMAGRPVQGKYQKWYNTMKLVFDTNLNKLPSLADENDDAFWDRWDIIEFEKIFTRETADLTIWEDIYTYEGAEVLSSLARYKGKYKFDPDTRYIKDYWLRNSDSVRQWLITETIQDSHEECPYEMAYLRYSKFCNKYGLHLYQEGSFKRHLLKMGIVSSGSGSSWYYVGFSLKDIDFELSEPYDVDMINGSQVYSYKKKEDNYNKNEDNSKNDNYDEDISHILSNTPDPKEDIDSTPIEEIVFEEVSSKDTISTIKGKDTISTINGVEYETLEINDNINNKSDNILDSLDDLGDEI